ncbi:protein obstructor-E-like [Ctenocephalides felis]|uniref:protein obstructor-E-like n=1 Tax=Ctenocephalides felis TaxID=7515 RepID=UPI000E6E32EE|nr:protein obstructor-E-like [Ctenocephalides felis]
MKTILLALTCFFVGAIAVDFTCPSENHKSKRASSDISYYPDEIQCDLYYKCTSGNPVGEPKLCPDGLVFSDRSTSYERCDLPDNVDCGDRLELQPPQSTDLCPRQNGMFRVDSPEACDRFVQCVNGHVIVTHKCPPGLIYDDERAQQATCVWPRDAVRKDCGKPKKEVLLPEGFSCPDSASEASSSDSDAAPLPHPTYPDPNNCGKFFICRGGRDPQRGACSDGEAYNPDLSKCDEPKNVRGCEDYTGEEDDE